MKTQNIAALLMENCKTIGVRFKANIHDIYVYKTTEDFTVGNHVVVLTEGKFAIGKVMEVHNVPMLDMDSNVNYQWIVQKIDTTKYDEYNALEAEFNEHLIELEQRALKANAVILLTEKLGIKNRLLSSAISRLNGVGQ